MSKKTAKPPAFKVAKQIKPFWEDKIKSVRKFLEPQSARAARPHRPDRPHFKTLKTVLGLVAPLGLAVIILLLASSFFFPKDRFQQAKERLVKNPQDLAAHLILAEEFLNNHQIQEAEKELALARQIEEDFGFQNNQVLGETTDTQLEKLGQQIEESDPKKINTLINEWEKIVAQKPDYRDGYLRLALYHYKLYDKNLAWMYLQKAQELDPNFEATQLLEKELSN